MTKQAAVDPKPEPAPPRDWEPWEDEQLVGTMGRQWERWHLARNRRKLIKRLAAIQHGSPELRTLLDFGCGTCQYYPLVRELGFEYTGCDRASQMRSHARLKFPEVEIYEDDLLESLTPDESFDVVMCNDVLVHLPDPVPPLQTLHRIARRFVIMKLCLTTTRRPRWTERLRPSPSSYQQRRPDKSIRHYYNLDELRKLIETELDPRSVRVDTFVPIQPPSAWRGMLPTWEAIVSLEKR